MLGFFSTLFIRFPRFLTRRRLGKVRSLPLPF
jgi:hypothetical protein